MKRYLLAEFSDHQRLAAAARRASSSCLRVAEAYTPYPVEDVSIAFEHHASRIRPAMFVGGVIMAALAYGLEYYSAVINYPYNSGGRPFDAWPTFMLVPFAIGILIAAVCGFAAFLFETGLPKLSDPLFGVDGFERASQSHFLLAVELPREQDEQRRAVHLLEGFGAIAVREVER
jgi:Alternative complex III, ActD subunit